MINGLFSVYTTEYTQSGNGRFLVYIPSWWKKILGLLGWGMHAHPLSLQVPSRTKLQCALQLSSHLYPKVLCGLRYSLLCVADSDGPLFTDSELCPCQLILDPVTFSPDKFPGFAPLIHKTTYLE